MQTRLYFEQGKFKITNILKENIKGNSTIDYLSTIFIL